MFDVKRIEGRRWHGGVKYWSVPASLRVWKQLEALGFQMLEFGGMPRYVRWLQNGCDVGYGVEGVDGLFHYQKQGVMRCLTRAKMVLADDPGLGKTWQAIEWARRKQHRKLVVAPKVVLGQWRDAIYQRYSVYPSQGSNGEHPTIRLRAPSWGSGEWNIVNYEFLPKLERVEGDFDLIVDEVHLCGNTKTARTKHVLHLANSSKRLLALTGTPPSKPSKVWPLFLMTGERSAKEFFPFALRYCGAERNDFGWDFGGATHLDELRDEMQHFMLRRTKAEVLHDLPPIIRSSLSVSSDSATVASQNSVAKADETILDLLSRGHSLTSGDGIGAVQHLRVLTSRQKVQTTVEYIQSLGTTRVVVFCYFRETMNELHTKLGTNEDCWVSQIHGDVSDDIRRDILNRFLGDEPGATLILQAGVGGLGLDGLQVASTAVVHDLPWTKDELDQIESRLHRQGQKNSVHIVNILSTSQVEKRMQHAIEVGKTLQEELYS